ncbi:MAG TPA: metallophosphoesterase [Phycisphaerae bacterium]|nr:metallophosphoesterase [Phycisphaerae bacterium]
MLSVAGSSGGSRVAAEGPRLWFPPMAGGITTTSARLYAMSPCALRTYWEWGMAPAATGEGTSPVRVNAPNTKIEPFGDSTLFPFLPCLTDLEAGTQYYYRLLYGPTSVPLANVDWRNTTGSFITARAPGTPYTFCSFGDTHVNQDQLTTTDVNALSLLDVALANVQADSPDFLLLLGDDIHTEMYTQGDSESEADSLWRHIAMRSRFAEVCRNIPIVFVLGNHEGEQYWREVLGQSLPTWALTNRKKIIPNYPAAINTRGVDHENIFTFVWGDVRHIVLDPFAFTAVQPHSLGGITGSGDPWDWTLGLEQYQFLEATLAANTSNHIMVWMHHKAGGLTTYGRGGAEAAHTHEWGGKELLGDDGWASHRDVAAGWTKPPHELLVDAKDAGANVIHVQGHDHVYQHDTVDDIEYVVCPRPNSKNYNSGFQTGAGIASGTVINNSGHLRWEVTADRVTCTYVRSCLWADENSNGGSQAYDNGDTSESWYVGT